MFAVATGCALACSNSLDQEGSSALNDAGSGGGEAAQAGTAGRPGSSAGAGGTTSDGGTTSGGASDASGGAGTGHGGQAGAHDSDAGIPIDAASDVDGAAPCEPEPSPMPTGATQDVTPPATIAAALSNAKAGDRLLLHAGSYSHEDISNLSFAGDVFIEAAAGEQVSLPGIHFENCNHLVFDGLRIEGTLELEGGSDFLLRNVTLDAGTSEDAALQLQGQHASGAVHDLVVQDSTLQGGGRTIFVLGSFAPSEQWNHHLSFVRNRITCGSHNCFQISGGRDLLIENNQILSLGTPGVLTAGATRVTISRNRFAGMQSQSSALQIATPGAEWDNYAGVENMISSDVLVANNVIHDWEIGVQLDTATNVKIVYNTVADGVGIRFNHRTPHDQANNVILDGNTEIKSWNNIFPSLSIDSQEARPVFESNNLVWGAGAGGTHLLTSDPLLDEAADYGLKAASPAIDAAIVNADTPLVDFDNRVRGEHPDIGAHERGAEPALCP